LRQYLDYLSRPARQVNPAAAAIFIQKIQGNNYLQVAFLFCK